MATKVNGFEAGTNGATIPSGSSNADPDSFTVALTGTATQTYSSTTPAHGSLCGLATSVTAGDTITNTFTGFTGGTLTCSVYLRVAAYPSSGIAIIKVRNSTNAVGAVNLRADGKLEVYDRSTLKHTTASAIGTGAWIRIEITATKGTTTTDGRVQFAYYSGDSETATGTYDSGTTVNAGTTDMSFIQLGWLTNTGTGALRLDSWQGVESALPVGPWVTDPLAQSQTDNAGTTDAGWSLDAGLTLAITDDSGAADEVIADGPLGDPPPGGGQSAALGSARLAGGVVWLYGLQESSGAATAGDVSGVLGRPTLTLTQHGTGGSVEFGSAGIMPEGTAVKFLPAATTTDTTDAGVTTSSTTLGGLTLGSAAVSAYLGTEFAVWLQFAWSGSTGVQLLQLGNDTTAQLVLTATPAMVQATLTTTTGSTRAVAVIVATGDNRPHFVMLTGSGNTLTLYVDTTEQNATTLPADMGRVYGLTLGGVTSADPHQVAWVGYSNAAMTPARFDDLAPLGVGGPERSDVRVARVLRWLGLAPDALLEVGMSDVGYTATGGRGALDVIADVNGVEDGVFFPSGDGRLVFHSRAHRHDRAVSAVFAAEDVHPDLEVAVDLTRVVNDLTASRPSGVTYRARNQTSIDAYGPRSASATIFAATDDDLRAAAQYRVARSDIAPRIPSITLDLLTTPGIAGSALALEVGDRIQVTGLPSTTTPGGATVSLFCEGFEETISATEWTLSVSTSRDGVPIYRLDTAELGTATLTY